MVVSVLANMVNPLVVASTSTSKWWLTRRLYYLAWGLTARIVRLVGNERRRERILATFAPVSVLALLGVWVLQQIVGFGVIWWA